MLAMKPIAGVRLTLVSDTLLTPYSGMLPGYLAGHYSVEETHLDLPRLCQAAQVRFIHARVTGIDLERKQLQLADPNFISQEEYNAFVNSNRTEKGHDLLEMMSFNVGKRIQTLQTLYSSKSKKSK